MDELEEMDESGEAESTEENEDQSEEWSAESEASEFMEIFREMADSEDSDAATDWGIDVGGVAGFVKPIVKMVDDIVAIGSRAIFTAARFGYRMAKNKLRENARKKQYTETVEEADEEDEEEEESQKDGGD